MTEIHPEFLQTIKQADWYYEFCDGLHDWNKAKKTYDSAIKIMRHLSEEQVRHILDTMVPNEMKDVVQKDLKR